MKLEDEKILVATRLMGWEIKKGGVNSSWEWISIADKNGDVRPWLKFEKWKPNEESKWWDEIWGKMDSEIARKYLCELQFRIITVGNYWEIHTAKPEICWKALVKTLEAK